MTRIGVPTRGAVALAVVVFGLAFSAPALAEVDQQPPADAPAEQAPEEQPAPEQPPEEAPAEEEPAPEEPTEEGTPSDGPTEEEQARYDRYCNQPDAEPSHSDKQFCDDFDARFGGTTTESETGSGPTEEEKARYERYCNQPDAEPSHSDKEFCEEYEANYGTDGSTGEGGTDTTSTAAKQSDDSEADSGPLAFTGLDLWQLGLIALVLIAGGIGIRRLMLSR
jgi:hypothetical protein